MLLGVAVGVAVGVFVTVGVGVIVGVGVGVILGLYVTVFKPQVASMSYVYVSPDWCPGYVTTYVFCTVDLQVMSSTKSISVSIVIVVKLPPLFLVIFTIKSKTLSLQQVTENLTSY